MAAPRDLSTTALTRSGLLRVAAGASAPLLLGGTFARGAQAARPLPGSLVISAAELAQVRANIFDLRLPFARRAWDNTVGRADNWLGYRPNPTRSDSDVSDWYNRLYKPGLEDGNAAYTLGLAYAIGRREDHARRAKEICLAWARTYRDPPSQAKIGHMVAEPVGPVIKLCMAFELTRPVFSDGERAEFRAWAAKFVRRGKENADYARDHPWVPDVTYGDDRTNPAPYGNSATWQRAMAVWASVVVGGRTLQSTLEWNFQHRTAGGNDYGWDNLIEGLVLDGTGGQVTEDRYRSSIEYGHFSWGPTILIADVARRARFRVDLFRYRTERHGYTVFTPVSYYERFLRSDTVPGSLEKTNYGSSGWSTTAARWRAVYELLYRATDDPQQVRTLRALVNWGGARRRGDNFDIYILNHAAVLGRGPKGPMPATPRKQPKG